MRVIVKCVIQREVHGKRRRGKHMSNRTPRSGNIAQWMDENVEEIMRDSRDSRDSRDRAIDGEIDARCRMGG